MTHSDPRDPRKPGLDPVTPAPSQADPSQPVSPHLSPRTSWGLLGGLAAALVLVFVVMTMMGGGTDRTATTPAVDRPPIAEGTPAGVPPADPTTTGTVAPAAPSAEPVPSQPAPTTPAPAQPAPGQQP